MLGGGWEVLLLGGGEVAAGSFYLLCLSTTTNIHIFYYTRNTTVDRGNLAPLSSTMHYNTWEINYIECCKTSSFHTMTSTITIMLVAVILTF